MFDVRDLSFYYQTGSRSVEILKDLNFQVQAGEFVGIQGPSGSGKSTLFYILGFLLGPSSGKIVFDNLDITDLSADELTVIRSKRIGFVFQQFHLLPGANVLDNIALPSCYPSELASPDRENKEKALTLAQELGLGTHLSHLPNQLSGGQQQRVAIARALMNDVDVILADEPTGNLDSHNAKLILDLLADLNKQGKTIILITHDSEVAKRCSRVYHLKDGKFTNIIDHFRPAPRPEKSLSKPNVSLLPKNYSFSVYKKIGKSVFPLVIANLLRNKAKSMLTMLGVIIGVAAVLAMVTLGQFTKRKILNTYETLGVNKLLIQASPNWDLKATDMVFVTFQSFDWDRDLNPLKKLFPEIKYISPVMANGQNTAAAGGVSVGVVTIGVTPEYLAITNRRIDMGQNFSPFHIESRSHVCLIGTSIAGRFFSRVTPLGKVINITDGQKHSFPCQVIGVLSSVITNSEWETPNSQVLLPYTYLRTVGQDWLTKQINEVTLKIESEADVQAAGKKVRAYFDQKYGKAATFTVDSDSTLIAQMKRFLTLFSVLLTAIALLSLIVGGIGINNMMLVSVTERIKEFGIRKALGATNRSLRIQVLMESMGLCMVAGILGVLFGFGAYELMIYGATKFVPHLTFEWVFEPLAAILTVVSIVAVGIASGFVPALRAEKLQVIEALRSE